MHRREFLAGVAAATVAPGSKLEAQEKRDPENIQFLIAEGEISDKGRAEFFQKVQKYFEAYKLHDYSVTGDKIRPIGVPSRRIGTEMDVNDNLMVSYRSYPHARDNESYAAYLTQEIPGQVGKYTSLSLSIDYKKSTAEQKEISKVGIQYKIEDENDPNYSKEIIHLQFESRTKPEDANIIFSMSKGAVKSLPQGFNLQNLKLKQSSPNADELIFYSFPSEPTPMPLRDLLDKIMRGTYMAINPQG